MADHRMEGQSVLESCLWRRVTPSQEYLISSSAEDDFNFFYYEALSFENLSVNIPNIILANTQSCTRMSVVIGKK